MTTIFIQNYKCFHSDHFLNFLSFAKGHITVIISFFRKTNLEKNPESSEDSQIDRKIGLSVLFFMSMVLFLPRNCYPVELNQIDQTQNSVDKKLLK